MNFINKGDKGRIEKFPLSGFRTYRAEFGALVDYKASPGDEIQEGELLCTLYCEEKTVKKVYALKNGKVLNRCPSSNIQQGMRLFQVLEKN